MSGRNSVTLERNLKVLFDGWSLVYSPGSPPALHLFELLAALPDGVQAILALPAGLPASSLTETVHQVTRPTKNSLSAHLGWEQINLSRLARRCEADLLHMVTPFPPLYSPVPVLVSPAEPLFEPYSFSGVGHRLRFALAHGALTNAHLLWPTDLPVPLVENLHLHRFSPIVHPAFQNESPNEGNVFPLPEAFILAPGPYDDTQLQDLLAAWRWVSRQYEQEWLLVVTNLQSHKRGEVLQELRSSSGRDGNVHLVTPTFPHQLATLLRQAEAVLRVGPVLPWGDPLLQSLASGQALAAEETYGASERVGPAAYLAPVGDARTLGAALLTLLVEEQVAESLRQAAVERASKWSQDLFREGLRQLYQSLK